MSDQMTFQTLELQVDNRLATLWLNRPEVRNAFNDIMIAELAQAFKSLGERDEIRAIVLAARGPAFCAGADLNYMKKMAGFSREENLTDAVRLADMLQAVYACPKPVIARVQGDCYAGGLGLMTACDIVIAAEGTHFCLSETRIGLIPATISPYVIGAIGRSAARRYFLTAERFDAEQAQRIGLVHAAVVPANLDTTVAGLAQALLANSPHAVKQAKRLVREVAGAPLTDTLIADTAERIADIRASDEGREGVRAFLEKRKPGWTT